MTIELSNAVTPILLWHYRNAPLACLRGEVPEAVSGMLDISDMADEDDWVALVPPEMKDKLLPWGERDEAVVWTCFSSTRNLRQSPLCAKIYLWDEAPMRLKALSNHGGDEDWLAVLPRRFGNCPLLHTGTNFAPCRASKYKLRDGRTIRIGAHA